MWSTQARLRHFRALMVRSVQCPDPSCAAVGRHRGRSVLLDHERTRPAPRWTRVEGGLVPAVDERLVVGRVHDATERRPRGRHLALGLADHQFGRFPGSPSRSPIPPCDRGLSTLGLALRWSVPRSRSVRIPRSDQVRTQCRCTAYALRRGLRLRTRLLFCRAGGTDPPEAQRDAYYVSTRSIRSAGRTTAGASPASCRSAYCSTREWCGTGQAVPDVRRGRGSGRNQ